MAHYTRQSNKYKPVELEFAERWLSLMRMGCKPRPAEALKIGLTALQYCESCHGDTLVIYNSKFPPTCQICVMNVKQHGEITDVHS